MKQPELIPHLFRTEFTKITAVLCRTFGLAHVEVAEDLAGEVFLSALETWPLKGIPENSRAWLYAVAKNKARNYIARTRSFSEKVLPELPRNAQETETTLDLSDGHIFDSQLRMMFAICHPSIPPEAQVGLALRLLCGFGIEEIANAFLTSKETVNKRLFRAKEKLRTGNIKLEFPDAGVVPERLDRVLMTLYLLFNEGYYSESRDELLREDLCQEAMRLTYLLVEDARTDLPQVKALLALMCFHASRFDARKGENGEIILYEDQDEALWNQELIAKGVYFLRDSARGTTLSRYHLEAQIAYWQTVRTDSREKWESILQLYNQLLMMAYSPVAALNRTFVLSKVKGKGVAIAEAEKLNLNDNPYYFTLLGELYRGTDNVRARQHFENALALARTAHDRNTILEKIRQL